MKISTPVGTTILFVCGLIGASLFYPVGSPRSDNSPKSRAKNDVTQIATASVAYETEYGHCPPSPAAGVVGGELLATLMGSNRVHNPRNIVFIEIQAAVPGKKSGLSNGTFVDPWGEQYFIAMDTEHQNRVVAGTNNVELRKKVAVWNDPRQHTDTSWFGPPKRDRRYVTSWE